MSKSLASKSFTNPDVLKEPEKTHSASVDLRCGDGHQISASTGLEMVRVRQTFGGWS